MVVQGPVKSAPPVSLLDVQLHRSNLNPVESKSETEQDAPADLYAPSSLRHAATYNTMNKCSQTCLNVQLHSEDLKIAIARPPIILIELVSSENESKAQWA